MKETGAHAVKLEGGVRSAEQIRRIVSAGIPVMAHIGFTPQSEHQLGGHVIQGRGERADELLADAHAVEDAGAFAVVLEMVPADVAEARHRRAEDPDDQRRRRAAHRRPAAGLDRLGRPHHRPHPEVRQAVRRTSRRCSTTPRRPGSRTSARAPTPTPSTPTTSRPMAEARIGISGWVYAPWRGVFYPKGLRQADELAYASSHVTSIELNGSFYSLQRPASWQRGATRRPTTSSSRSRARGSSPTSSGSRRRRAARELLRLRRPRDGRRSSARSSGSCRRTSPYDAELIERFLATPAAHDRRGRSPWHAAASERMTGKEYLEIDADRPMRHAIEPRIAHLRRPGVRRAARRGTASRPCSATTRAAGRRSTG